MTKRYEKDNGRKKKIEWVENLFNYTVALITSHYRCRFSWNDREILSNTTICEEHKGKPEARSEGISVMPVSL
jgi:hypothetical protein